MEDKDKFIEKVLKAFKKINREIEAKSHEYDIRYRFVKYFIEDVLGYEPRYIKWERKRTDLTLLDENNFAIVKIETKRPSENIDKTEYEKQAFKYKEETTRYIGLTNFIKFKLWEIKDKDSVLKVDIDFSKILKYKNLDKLSEDERIQILFLINLTKRFIFDPSKYEIR